MSQSAVSSGKVRKRKSKMKTEVQVQRAVLKMLRVMETSGDNTQDPASEFLGTGRTGRRNALPDILGQNAQTSCSDLPDRLQSLCSVAPESSSTQNEAAGDQSRVNPNTNTPMPKTADSGS